MDPGILNFLKEREDAWLKPRLKSEQSEEEQELIRQEGRSKFLPSAWIPDAAKRAAQLAMSTHPSKFSHPDAKTSNILAVASQSNDGYLRSGNVPSDLDVFGNAAAMDVYKFLMVSMDDGRSLLDHLEENTEQAKQILNALPDGSAETLRGMFLAIKADGPTKSQRTDRLVKQVYMPVGSGQYHLLSILTPSGMVTALKERLDRMRFSDEAKEAREARKQGRGHATGFSDIFDLTYTAYGGTQPQNISVLNSRNAGRAYLLPSLPPKLNKDRIRLPKRNFFSDCLNPKDFSEAFEDLHQWMLLGLQEDCPIPRSKLHKGVETLLLNIIRECLAQVYVIHNETEGWSTGEAYQDLLHAHKIWLDAIHHQERNEDDAWLAEVILDFASWVYNTYQKMYKKDHLSWGNAELSYVQSLIEDVIKKEGFCQELVV